MKISIKQYSQTLLELTENKPQEELLIIIEKFAEMLKENGQLKNAEKIMEKFGELYNSAHGIVVAEVTTKYKIQDTRYSEIEKFIKSRYKAKVIEITNIVNEDIKGGIIIRVGDEIIDGSVANELKKLKNILSK